MLSKQLVHETMLQKMLDTRMKNVSRRNVIRFAAVAGGAAAAGITFGGSTFAQDATPMGEEEAPFGSPVDVLNYALTLEHLESAFYRDGLASIGSDGFTALGFDASVFDRLTKLGEQEAQHVETLTSVINDLGGEPVAESTYDFGYADATGFLATSQALEDTGVSAYQGAAKYLMAAPDLLTAALTIHGVEGRHAAYVALLNSASPFPEAFNPTLTPAEVLDIATPFITG